MCSGPIFHALQPQASKDQKRKNCLSFRIVPVPHSSTTHHDTFLGSPTILVARICNPSPQYTSCAMTPLPSVLVPSHLLSTASLHLHVCITDLTAHELSRLCCTCPRSCCAAITSCTVVRQKSFMSIRCEGTQGLICILTPEMKGQTVRWRWG